MAEIISTANITGTILGSQEFLESSVELQTANITILKTANRAVWINGDVTFTITLNNQETEENFTGLSLQNTFEPFSGITFVENSVQFDDGVNVTTSQDQSYDSETGILRVNDVPDIPAGSTLVITFQFRKVQVQP